MMAHRDRLNALAAAELGRARPTETQVEISLTPANDAKGDDSSPAARVSVNDVLAVIGALRFLSRTILSMTMGDRPRSGPLPDQYLRY